LETKLSDKNHFIEDVQAQVDTRNLNLDQVGICNLKMPLKIRGCEIDPSNEQSVSAKVSLSVDLQKSQRGIHMSRLVETLIDYMGSFSVSGISGLLEELCLREQASKSFVSIEFDYYFDRVAPVSGKSSPQAYKCFYEGSYNGETSDITQGVNVRVKTLCPCSKTISDYGAHSQRSNIFVSVTHIVNGNKELNMTIEDLIEIAERGASSPLYPLLKREDERYVTMNAYDNPGFVEDVVRNVAVELRGDKRFDYYKILVKNFESIHSHDAFALTHSNNNGLNE